MPTRNTHFNHAMIEQSPASVMIYLDDGQCIYANPSAIKVTYKTFEELTAMNFHDVPQLKESGVYPKILKILEDNIPTQFDSCIVLDNGVTIHSSSTMYTYVFEGRRYLTFQWIDTTEQKTSEAKLLQTSKMAALGEMAAGMAHEINNPLSILRGRAELLSTLCKKVPIDAEKISSSSQNIIETVERIAKIIKGLKSFSRTNDGDPISSASTNEVLQDVLSLCVEKFRMKNIEIRLKNEQDFRVKCRAPQLCQVLINLLNNAYDAVSPLENKWVEITTQQRGSNTVLTITDSGNGIPLHIREKIMQPFFTTKPVGQGTGLGLSISKGLIEAMGGTFEYGQSSPNTQFIISLASN